MGKVKKPSSHNLPVRPLKVPITNKVSKGKQKLKQLKGNLLISDKINKAELLKLNVNVADLNKEKETYKASKNLAHKSVKSRKLGSLNNIKKKEKQNLKRTLLLKKLDQIKEIKKEEKDRKKRKNISVMGDTNPLRDALPSLDLILKNKKEVNDVTQIKKKRGIEKAKKRKKTLFSDMDLFKRAINDKTFKTNPFEIISHHIEAVVERDRSTVC